MCKSFLRCSQLVRSHSPWGRLVQTLNHLIKKKKILCFIEQFVILHKNDATFYRRMSLQTINSLHIVDFVVFVCLMWYTTIYDCLIVILCTFVGQRNREAVCV